ncbi:MAG: hypothetical protein AABM67_21635 [Acidobacteriota bacterium]
MADRVNHLCSSPACRAPTGGPQLDPSKALNVGVAAHITAASPEGPRFNRHLTPEQRKHADNAIWLCQNCGKLIDNDPERFTEKEIRHWKEEAEAEAFNKIGKPLAPARAHPTVSEGERLTALLGRIRAATSELTGAWIQSRRLLEKPQIALRAVIQQREDRLTEASIDLQGIRKLLNEGVRLVLEAPAGTGKTTTLLQVAQLYADEGELCFLIDLPLWAKSGNEILEFIVGRREFLSHGISAQELASFYPNERFTFLLNGWNEVSDNYSEDSIVALRELERSFPSAGIIVATRTRHISPPLVAAIRAKLQPLTRAQRDQYLTESLGNRAYLLGSTLDSNAVLDDLTRTPLILSEVTTIFASGKPIPPTKMGVLAVMMSLIGQADEHRDQLQRVPLCGHAADYLATLAIEMTARGANTVQEEDARSILRSVSVGLRDRGQIENIPEPADILKALVDHHVVEQLDYYPATFRFKHQQFQEFYAAKMLERRLWDLKDQDSSERRNFASQYVDSPTWEEPLRMVAEEIGELSADQVDNDAARVARLLIEIALTVDPVFAADLSRLCGSSVWSQVRHSVGERLRLWYQVPDENHQQCALAGMLATGSDDFIDVLLPLLTNGDQHVRLSTYRAGSAVHLSSLGVDWRGVVRGWPEKFRIEFIYELTHNRWDPEIADAFALGDPSQDVRVQAIDTLSWAGSESNIVRLLEAQDEETFERMVQKLSVERIPPSLRERALAVNEKALDMSSDTMTRVRLMIRASELGNASVWEKIKEELGLVPSGRIQDHDSEYVIRPALNIIRARDSQWASDWLARRIADGSLRREGWIDLVLQIPEDLRERLVHGISDEEPAQIRTAEFVSLLPIIADAPLAETIFNKLCEIRRTISDIYDEVNNAKRGALRLLEDLFRSLPANDAVAGLSNCFAKEYDITEFTTVIELFSRVNSKDSDLRNELSEDLRQNLRLYLKKGLQFALGQDDFRGELKAQLATALARIGDPGDMQELNELTTAEIQRLRTGRTALAQGDRSPTAKGGSITYARWHLEAVASLDAAEAEPVLLRALQIPESEIDAASALVGLATTQTAGGLAGAFAHRERDYCRVWEAREQRKIAGVDSERCQRYATAMKERISVLLEEREESLHPGHFDYRLIELANMLAALDGLGSSEVVFKVLSLPVKFFVHQRIDALENLLFGGVTLPTQSILDVLNPIIDYILSETQDSHLAIRGLCLLPFVDNPPVGIDRVRQVITDKSFPRYELRGILPALACSRCPTALTLIGDIAGTLEGPEYLLAEWINAVSTFGGTESKQLILSFLDPEAAAVDGGMDLKSHGGDLLAKKIAELAASDPIIRVRILELCDVLLPAEKRALLAKVIAEIGSEDAILAGLNILDDGVTSNHTATSAVPYHLWKAIESLFVEHRPHKDRGTTYSLIPRSSNPIRARLLEMTLTDDQRWKSAFGLLGQIEVWRLDYGKPETEPRHPAFERKVLWPPDEVLRKFGTTV